MGKEIRIPHAEIRDPQTITDVQERAFEAHGLDMHRHEVDELIDDHARGERILKVKTPRMFLTVPDLPWTRKAKA
jgi:hypothetical protein